MRWFIAVCFLCGCGDDNPIDYLSCRPVQGTVYQVCWPIGGGDPIIISTWRLHD